jgi:hypothetical protein
MRNRFHYQTNPNEVSRIRAEAEKGWTNLSDPVLEPLHIGRVVLGLGPRWPPGSTRDVSDLVPCRDPIVPVPSRFACGVEPISTKMSEYEKRSTYLEGSFPRTLRLARLVFPRRPGSRRRNRINLLRRRDGRSRHRTDAEDGSVPPLEHRLETRSRMKSEQKVHVRTKRREYLQLAGGRAGPGAAVPNGVRRSSKEKTSFVSRSKDGERWRSRDKDARVSQEPHGSGQGTRARTHRTARRSDRGKREAAS